MYVDDDGVQSGASSPDYMDFLSDAQPETAYDINFVDLNEMIKKLLEQGES